MSLTDSVRTFYDDNAASWDSSRNYAWPGWVEAWKFCATDDFKELSSKDLSSINSITFKVLDLGCGNGRFAAFLLSKLPTNVSLDYCGVDISTKLLEKAREHARAWKSKNPASHFKFKLANLADLNTLDDNAFSKDFDLIVSIATLHHLPIVQSSLDILAWAARRLKQSGKLLYTTWEISSDPVTLAKSLQGQELEQYLHDNKLSLNKGDHILNWKASGSLSYRFAHEFSTAEKAQLISATSLKPLADFKADGKNGKLNHYYILEKTS